MVEILLLPVMSLKVPKNYNAIDFIVLEQKINVKLEIYRYVRAAN